MVSQDYDISIRVLPDRIDHEDRHPVIKAGDGERREPSTAHHASCADI